MLDRPFDATYDPDSSVLAVSGSVDPDVADDLAEAMESARNVAEHRVTVDLSGVTYLPSIAVAVLVRGLKQALHEAVDLVLVAAQGTAAQHVLQLTGVPYQQYRVADGLLPDSSV